MFSGFRAQLVSRVILLGATVGLFCIIWDFQGVWGVSRWILLVAFIYQTKLLIDFVERTNKDMVQFLRSIRHDDFSIIFSHEGRGKLFEQLSSEFNNVVDKFRRLRAEKESEYQYFKNIISHVGIGILSFQKNGSVQFVNTAAKKLLRVNQLSNISQLESFSPELLNKLQELYTGQKALVSVRNGGETVQLAIYAIELILNGEEYKLITIQNIASELEERELEAWQKLIRVLTHEIMNSVTPISSLASSLLREIEYMKTGENTTEDWDDLTLAAATIKRRSEGLSHFVAEFRTLAHVPALYKEHIVVREMFDELVVLMSSQVEASQITLSTDIEPQGLLLTADRKLIEQVLINLLRNACQSLEGSPLPRFISLQAQTDKTGHTLISVKDNGQGIEKEALERIFIPFFTTKPNGSGIGLSISRQIMRLHGGSITAQSEIGQGAEFTLRF